MFEFQFIFGDLQALEFKWVDGMFPNFSSYVYILSFFLPVPETNPKHHIMKTKYNKWRKLSYLITFILFLERFEDKHKFLTINFYFLNYFIYLGVNLFSWPKAY